jgi:fatty-acyl-CoA synthase
MFASKRITTAIVSHQQQTGLLFKNVIQHSNKSSAVFTVIHKGYATNQEDAAKYSYLQGEKTKPNEHTIGYHLSALARAAPHHNAVRSSHQQLTHSYATLKKNVEALACGLLELGLRPGDRLGLIQGTNVEHLVTQLACAKLGAALVEFTNVKTAKDFTRMMELFRPRIVVAPQKLGKVDYYKMLYNEIFPELKQRDSVGDYVLPFKSKAFPYCRQVLLTSFTGERGTPTYQFKDVFCYGPFGYYENPLRRIAMTLTPEDPALITFNGSDVNKATPIVYSQQNLITVGQLLSKELGLKSSDRVMVPSYQDNAFGAALGNFTAFTSGATVVYPSEEWNAAETLKQLSQEQCTTLFIKGSELEQLVDSKDLSKYKFETLKNIVVDSSASPDLISKAKSALNVTNVVRSVGSDEVSGVLTVNDKVAPNTEVKITRQQDGKIVHRDTVGDIKVKGPIVAKGWWNDVGLMQPKLDEDGWFSTGKVGKINAEGKLSLQ